ncbi:lysylphosphatidylglycerol synthase transmembrane domain-containing protein [Hippea jasoniae]|uniref:lysylphosphatidylglycerol synthase transmembrane domain-containing protein n=1 Tax=Hippea jasoniae TaxID=944479 RepID=UPI00054D526B|nr:lysylphosphatidylglycerol synthase transmembrane domain-containing protein [Hippea jasoniae]
MAKLLIKISISAILIAFILTKIDISQLQKMMLKIGIFHFVVMVVLLIFAQFISSIRWSKVIKSIGKTVDMLTLFKLYMMGMFANLFLPGIIGGDVLKAYLLSKKIGWQKSISSIFLERYNGLVALLLLSFASAVISEKLLGLKIAAAIASVSIAAIVAVFLLKFIKHTKVQNFYKDIVIFHKSREFFSVFILSFVVQLISVGLYIYVAVRFGYHINIAYFFAFIPIITLISFIPISFNGIGVREFSFIYFFRFAHLNATEAVSLSLAVFFVGVAASLIGGLFYLNEKGILKEAKSIHR